MHYADRKYKFRRAGVHTPRGPLLRNEIIKYYQLIALRDIPEHGVKAGDFGGYVSNKNALSHEGSCWIGPEAEVVGNVSIYDDAYIGGTVSVVNLYSRHNLVIKDRVKIIEDARVRIISVPGKPQPAFDMTISGDVEIAGSSELFNVGTVSGKVKIYEDAHLFSCKEISGDVELFGTTNITGVGIISGNVKIYGGTHLEFCEEISGDIEIFGHSVFQSDVNILGNSKIYGSALIGKGALIRDSEISGSVKVRSYERVNDAVVNDEETLRLATAKEFVEKPKTAGIMNVYNEILANIHSYESDIVKIIKYPQMTDRTDPHTLQMILALNTTKRLVDKPWEPEFKDAVRDLEAKFLMAESNALKISGTGLSESDKKKTQKAKDLLAIASNESANENEKRMSFEQAFKQLEGIIVVPEAAIDSFRIKIGLPELEA